MIGIGLVVLIAGAVGLLEAVPLNNFKDGAQQIMSERLGVPVSISGLRYSLLQTQLTLERVSVGKLQETRIDSIVVKTMPMALLGSGKSFGEVEVISVSADQDALALVPDLIKPAAGDQALRVKRVKMRGVKLATRGMELPTFDGDVTLGADGGLQRAVLTDGKVKVEITPKE